MGWTTYMATNYKNGKVDAKAEMDKHYSWENENYTNKVIKSAMVGSTYYCAVETVSKANGSREVWAGVALTSKNTRDGMTFGYKDMDETEIPYQYKCPKGILDLLTPTENENANEWRRLCREERERPKLSDLPIGAKIKWNGKELRKMEPMYQFKTTWYMVVGENKYIPKSRIKNWEVL